ncbi:hypothetical protein F0562_016402 [Nyssa sinensis]|uniref:Uncharacterized protein n=1 Tax=Nyssa sinensis TaxID=561372 RepID=A0A5J4ZM20_9ASTE|nr:hypothetical protein F0562_016402 [Nyssa sinensis]
MATSKEGNKLETQSYDFDLTGVGLMKIKGLKEFSFGHKLIDGSKRVALIKIRRLKGSLESVALRNNHFRFSNFIAATGIEKNRRKQFV